MGGTMGPPVMRAIPQPTGGSSARGGACGRRRGPPPRGCTAPQPTAAKPILESIFLGPQTIDGPPAMTTLKIRQLFAGARIVILTQYDDPMTRAAARQAGA